MAPVRSCGRGSRRSRPAHSGCRSRSAGLPVTARVAFQMWPPPGISSRRVSVPTSSSARSSPSCATISTNQSRLAVHEQERRRARSDVRERRRLHVALGHLVLRAAHEVDDGVGLQHGAHVLGDRRPRPPPPSGAVAPGGAVRRDAGPRRRDADQRRPGDRPPSSRGSRPGRIEAEAVRVGADVGERAQAVLHVAREHAVGDQPVVDVERDVAGARSRRASCAIESFEYLLQPPPWIIKMPGRTTASSGRYTSIRVASPKRSSYDTSRSIVTLRASQPARTSVHRARTAGYTGSGHVVLRIAAGRRFASVARRSGIPAEVVYQPKWQLALAMVRRAVANGLTGIVLADSLFGTVTEFRQQLAATAGRTASALIRP